MSWTSPSKKGGLKGGFRLVSEENEPVSVPLVSPSKKLLLQNTAIKIPLPTGDPISLAASSSPPVKDCIKLALSLQFDSAEASSSADPFNDIISNVQRVLSESIDFVTAKNPHNGLLLEIQKNCTDVSKIRVKNQTGSPGPSVKKSGMLAGGDRSSYDVQFKTPLRNGNVNGQLTTASSTSSSPTKKSNVEEQLPDPKFNFYDEKNIRLDWPRTDSVGGGLFNVGNTCFLNATLQCLAYTPALLNFLTTDNHAKKCDYPGYCITCKLQELLPNMLRSKNTPVRPYTIFSNIKAFAKTLSIGRQEDAHEFLRFVVEAMRKTALAATGKDVKTLDLFTQETTFASRIFGGFYRSRVLCQSCKQPSSVYDPFMDVPLDIARVDTLEEALKTFTRVEVLNSPNNLYRCERCNKSCPATKQVTIHKPPSILTFQLKRFLFNSFSSFSKIDKPVQFPETLDLRPYMSQGESSGSIMYKLYAVLVHSGSSCHSGHYYSFVKTANNTWFRMDDTSVNPAGQQNVLSQRAYLLFYTRVQSVSLPAVVKNFQENAAFTSAASRSVYGPLQNHQNGNVKPATAIKAANLFFQTPTSKSSEATQSGAANRTPLSAASLSQRNGTANGLLTGSGVTQKPVFMQFIPRNIDINNRLAAAKTNGSPKKAPLSPVKAAQSALVPYADEDEESEAVGITHPEPNSRGSSTSSTDSVKENKDNCTLESAKKSAAVALEPSMSSSLQSSPTASVATVGTSPVKGELSVVATPTTSSEPSAGAPSSLVQSLSKRAARKLKRKLLAVQNGGTSSSAPVTLEGAQVGDSAKSKKKKKKKRNKRRRDDSGSDEPSPTQNLVWVEKDIASLGEIAAAVACERKEGLEAQPEAKSRLRNSTGDGGVHDRSEILSWSGGKSILEREVGNSSLERRKREFEQSDSYDDQFDAGKSKKFKSKHASQSGYRNGGNNAFQSFQNYRTSCDSRSKSVATPGQAHSHSYNRPYRSP